MVVTIKLLIRHDKLEVHPQNIKESTAAHHNSQAGCYVQIVRRCYASVAGTCDRITVTSNSKRHTGTAEGNHSLLFTSAALVTMLLVQRIGNFRTITDNQDGASVGISKSGPTFGVAWSKKQPECVWLCKQTALIWWGWAGSTIVPAATSQLYYLLSYTKYRCCKVWMFTEPLVL